MQFSFKYDRYLNKYRSPQPQDTETDIYEFVLFLAVLCAGYLNYKWKHCRTYSYANTCPSKSYSLRGEMPVVNPQYFTEDLVILTLFVCTVEGLQVQWDT